MFDTFVVAERCRESPGGAIMRGLGLATFGFARWTAAARRRARTQRILSHLDNGALKDIGLVRSQIDGIDRDPRYTPFPGELTRSAE